MIALKTIKTMSAKKSNIDTAKESKKEKVRVCKREKIVVSFVSKS